MKKKLSIYLLCLLGLLTACNKEPEYTDADFGTIIEYTENIQESTEQGTIETTETIEEKEYKGNIIWALFDVKNIENNFYVEILNNPYFKGGKDKISGIGKEDIKHTSNIKVIDQISSGTGWDNNFSGSWDVFGDYLEDSIFVIYPTVKQEYDMVSLGVNYFDSLFQGKAYECEKIQIKHMDYVEFTNIIGDFEFFIYPFTDEHRQTLGFDYFTVKGNVETASNIKLSFKDNKIYLDSNNNINNLTLEVEKDIETQEEPIINNVSFEPKTNYIFHLENYVPVLK